MVSVTAAIAKEKQEGAVLSSIGGFDLGSLKHAETDEKNILPDQNGVHMIRYFVFGCYMNNFFFSFIIIIIVFLLSKLSKYGIRGILLSWLKGYLNLRSQYVSINGVNSDYNYV